MLEFYMRLLRKSDSEKRNLLILNYVMDEEHPALAHQVSVAEGLANAFDYVTVITGNSNYVTSKENLRVVSSNWVPNQNFRNIFKFLKVFLREMIRTSHVRVFSHMTVIQSCSIGPLLRVFRIRHFLWYAHAQNSIYLGWAHFWCSGLITSTLNSCPIRSNKIHYIGQSIDEELFSGLPHLNFPMSRLIHVGRLDPSKDIGAIIDSAAKIRHSNPALTLMLLGSASNPNSQKYLEELKGTWNLEIEAGWLKFHESIPREKLPDFLRSYDVFVHAFQGSLDKSLVEATFSKLPVATTNREYQRDFGVWSENPGSLQSELESLLALDDNRLILETEHRLKIAKEKHSFSKWITELSLILD